MPDGQQQRDMQRCAGSYRVTGNKPLAAQKDRRQAPDKFTGLMPGAARRRIGKRHASHGWFGGGGSLACQQALQDSGYASRNFFARCAGRARAKRTNNADSVRYPEPNQIRPDGDNRRIFLPQWSAARPKLPRRAGHGGQRHDQPVGRQMVRGDAHATRACATHAHCHQRHWHRGDIDRLATMRDAHGIAPCHRFACAGRTGQKTTGQHRQRSCAWCAVTNISPMLQAPAVCQGEGMGKGCRQAV